MRKHCERARAFDRGTGDPALSTIFVGARGSGKTALLTYLGEEALSHGWITASVSAVPNMLSDIEERTLAAAREFVTKPDKLAIKGVTVGQLFGVEWEHHAASKGNWRTRMTNILDELGEHDVGLLIMVDEVRVDLDDMIQLASTYQHFIREGRKVALLMAGLPSKVSSLLRDDSVSFLRRANYRQLGRVSDREVSIVRHESQPVAFRLREHDAVERVVVSRCAIRLSKHLERAHVPRCYGKLLIARDSTILEKTSSRQKHLIRVSFVLYRDLPSRCHAEADLVRPCRNEVTRFPRKFRVVGERPEKYVRVEKELHSDSENIAATSSFMLVESHPSR